MERQRDDRKTERYRTNRKRQRQNRKTKRERDREKEIKKRGEIKAMKPPLSWDDFVHDICFNKMTGILNESSRFPEFLTLKSRARLPFVQILFERYFL